MKNTKKTERSRRKFLSLGLLGGASLIAPMAHAQGSEVEDTDTETIKMLTPDGKLVEVKKTVVAKSANRSKARNEDILNWSNTAKKAK
jgi:hypothetical protein